MGVCFTKNSYDQTAIVQTTKNHNGQQIISTTTYKSKTGAQMSTEDKTMASLKKVRDDLNHRLKEIEKGITDAESEAKKHMRSGNKPRAKFAIERKQLYEKYQDNVMNQGRTINAAIEQLKQTSDNKAAADVLKQANNLMKDISKAIDIDQMNYAMGNLQELEMNNEQFNELYQQYVGAGSEEVEEKYKQLEADVFKEDIKKHELNTQVVNVNGNYSEQQKKKEEEEIKQQQSKKNDELDDELAMLA